MVNNGSLHKIKPSEAEKYDLIIVDEAHKFRNDTAGSYTLLQKLQNENPTQTARWNVRHKKSHPDLSHPAKQPARRHAKPRPPVPRRKEFDSYRQPPAFLCAPDQGYDIAKRIEDEQQRHAEIIRIYSAIREQVVTPLTVRRTRRDLMEDKRYKTDLEEQGISFPHVEKPTPDPLSTPARSRCALRPHYSYLSCAPPQIAEVLTYNRYRAIAFLSNLKLREKYERADFIAQQLAGIMKTLLVKRIDSSLRRIHQESAPLPRCDRCYAANVQRWKHLYRS